MADLPPDQQNLPNQQGQPGQQGNPDYMMDTNLSVKYLLSAHHVFTHESHIDTIYSIANVFGWNTPNASFFNNGNIRIHVRLCAIFYLGPVGNLEHLWNDQIVAYWRNEARQQLGTHVFVSRYGHIHAIITDLHPANYAYSSRALTSINAIYPVYRMEPPNPTLNPTYRLTLGLIYKHYLDEYNDAGQLLNNPDYNKGVGTVYNRHYCRFNSYTDPINAGHVFELRERDFAARLTNNSLVNVDRYRCAFYVCAGAKLVVLDEYHEDIANMAHNRSLVQQGGLVIVESCRFRLSVIHDFGYYTLADAHTNGLLNGDRDLSLIQNPVIFLGPNESEYQSIAWNLSIKRNTAVIPTRDCVLTISQGARITAIEDWDAGMAEVRARQLYERLHESTVGNNPTRTVVEQMIGRFRVPEDLMLRRILGMPGQDGRHRNYNCDIFAVTQILNNYTAAVDLPKQFNMYTCTHIHPDFHQNATCAWVPPMYPRIKLYGKQVAQYMPSIGSENVLPIRDANQKVIQTYLAVDGKQNSNMFYVLDDQPVTIADKQMKKMHINIRAVNCPGFTDRLGIDGWFYEYEGNNNNYIPTIKFEMPIYKSQLLLV